MQFNDWLREPQGQQIFTAEYRELSRFLMHYYGRHMVQINMGSHINWFHDSPMLFQHSISESQQRENVHSAICTDLHELPFVDESVDMVLMPHVLEYEDASTVLAEVSRILNPEAHVILTGFNASSFWGASRLYHRKNKVPWAGKFYSISQVKRLLADNHCRVTQAYSFCDILPWQKSFKQKDDNSSQLFKKIMAKMGSLYLIIAQKQTARLTPLKLKWKKNRISMGNIVEPTTRG